MPWPGPPRPSSRSASASRSTAICRPNSDPRRPRHAPEMGRLTAIVLGAAAGGGFPQWNCRCDVCRLAWAGDPRVRPRTQASLAVSADGDALDAAQRLARSARANPATPRAASARACAAARSKPVVLTGAEIDQTAGLLSLRERSPFTLDRHRGDACRRRRQSDVRRARGRRGDAPRDCRRATQFVLSAAICRPSCSWCRARCRSISKATIRRPPRKPRPMSASRSPAADARLLSCPARRL